jgi:glycosyltransferase involved in cell wall biosynthesis
MYFNYYPKISIVTPVFNGEKYIQEMIESILNQNYPNLEFIIIDGGSSDGTLSVINKYRDRIDILISEKDLGIYDALNKGFKFSTGEIMTWINADDKFHQNSLFIAAELLSLENVNWITGFPNVIDEKSRLVKAGDNGFWSKLRLQLENTCIQQEGTFWNRILWERSGGYISQDYKLAGDFELWNRFFDFDSLYRVSALLGSFRISKSGQLSGDGIEYFKEVEQIRNLNLKSVDFRIKLEKYHRFNHLDKITKGIFTSFFETKISSLHSFPKEIVFNRDFQKFHFK